ncbi:MAG: hypothetical protein AABX30_01800 [Nanoarchaeota archaeon]
MKKGIIIASWILILVSVGFLVSAVGIGNILSYNSDDQTSIFQIKKGWNLIPTSGYRSETTCDMRNPELKKKAFIYSPTEKRYLKYLNENDYEIVKRDQDTKYRYISSGGGGIFMYSKVNCELVTFVPTINENNKIAEGWNFIAIEPQMVGEKVKDAFHGKDCIITKMAAWDSINQEWVIEVGDNRDELGESRIENSDIGFVYGVKYGYGCSLGLEEQEITPPEIP